MIPFNNRRRFSSYHWHFISLAPTSVLFKFPNVRFPFYSYNGFTAMYHLLCGRHAISFDNPLRATVHRFHLARVVESHDPRPSPCNSKSRLTTFSFVRTVTHSFSMIICMKHLLESPSHCNVVFGRRPSQVINPSRRVTLISISACGNLVFSGSCP